jgi:voltage-gated potassium channel
VVVLPVLRPLRALRLLRLFTLSRAAVVLINALTRVRGILTHRGLHSVLMGVTGIVVVGSGVELAFEQHTHGANIHNFGESLWWAIVWPRPWSGQTNQTEWLYPGGVAWPKD